MPERAWPVSPSCHMFHIFLKPTISSFTSSSIFPVVVFIISASQLPLSRANLPAFSTVKSKDHISDAEDSAMDQALPSSGATKPGVSIRNGPVEEMDVDSPQKNGNVNGKRKTRASLTNGKTNGKTYKEESSSEEDDKPLVRSLQGPFPSTVR